MNFVSSKLRKLLLFNAFPNIVCVHKPFPLIYTIFTWYLQKCEIVQLLTVYAGPFLSSLYFYGTDLSLYVGPWPAQVGKWRKGWEE
jgi:hypothetical protein